MVNANDRATTHVSHKRRNARRKSCPKVSIITHYETICLYYSNITCYILPTTEDVNKKKINKPTIIDIDKLLLSILHTFRVGIHI